jgi:UMF1 family MFS transporter
MDTKGRRAVISWVFYDWANSAFATTIMAGFFPIFFKQYWSAGVEPVISTARLGLANSLAGVIIALCAPALGAMADRGSARKRFLALFTLMGALMTAFFFLIPRGAWMPAMGVYVIAVIGFSGGIIFYDSLLPAVAPEERLDLVSGLGYAMGYLGGGLIFAVNVWMTLRPHSFGLSNSSEAVRVCFLSVGLWWIIFSLPLMLFVREPATKHARRGLGLVMDGFRALRRTFHEIRSMRMIFLFLLAYWFYIDGVDTIVRMAVDYGLSLGFKAGDLILALLLTQFVGFPCAILFGLLGERIGTKRAIFIAIGVYLFITVFGAFINSRQGFYLLAVIIGLVQGGIQALSRAFYARMIPDGKTAEYFGFYNMLGKFAVIIGPVLVGITGLAMRSAGIDSQLASRLGITSIALLFLAGGTLLYFVDEKMAQGAVPSENVTGE